MIQYSGGRIHGINSDEEMKIIINSRCWHIYTGHAWEGPIAITLIFPQLTLEGLVFTIL